jgi:hypothetical protein
VPYWRHHDGTTNAIKEAIKISSFVVTPVYVHFDNGSIVHHHGVSVDAESEQFTLCIRDRGSVSRKLEVRFTNNVVRYSSRRAVIRSQSLRSQ